MKAIITRASLWTKSKSIKPCEDVEKVSLIQRKYNHKTKGCEDKECEVWVLEFSDIMEVYRKHWPILLRPSNFSEIPLEIIICDDYVDDLL